MDEPQNVRMRNACGKSSREYKKYIDVELGGCTSIERTDNMIGACKAGRDNVLYYSCNEFEPLVNCMYKVGKSYYAIRVTIGESHDCGEADDGKILEDFFKELALQNDEELNLIYMVPDRVFKRFVTRPAIPLVPRSVGDKYILHADVKRPP